MIDICDFAVGLSRQLHGLTMHSERPDHRMYEQWHPIGAGGYYQCIQLPRCRMELERDAGMGVRRCMRMETERKDPLCSIACQHIVNTVFTRNNVPEGVSCIVNGGREVGEWLSRRPPATSDQRYGQHPHGQGRWCRGRRAARAFALGARRQQRHHHQRQGRSRHALDRRRCSVRWARQVSAAPAPAG